MSLRERFSTFGAGLLTTPSVMRSDVKMITTTRRCQVADGQVEDLAKPSILSPVCLVPYFPVVLIHTTFASPRINLYGFCNQKDYFSAARIG